MALVVADASPILSYARANQLGLLQGVLPDLVIPPVVYNEIVIAGAGRPGAQEVATSTWIRRQALTTVAFLNQVSPALDPGEREAIALALEFSCPLLIDEAKGRKEAERTG